LLLILQDIHALLYPTFVAMLIILLVVVIFLPAQCEAVTRIPNARYLGMGYNAFTGNPDNNLHDPGFKYGVLQFTWDTNITSSDQRYLVPDHTQVLQTKSCGFRSEATTEFGSRSYQNSLSVDVGVEASGSYGLWSARFTASTGYRKVSQGTTQYRRFYTSAKGKCIQYQLAVNYLNVPIQVTSAFARAVGALPLERNDDAYLTFIGTYGTHFTSRITLGAKMTILSEFDEKALTRMEEEGLNIQTAAQLSYSRFSSKITTETDIQRQQRESFERTRRSYAAAYLGSHPPSDGRWETWAQTTADSPYPVSYRLAPITSLFTNKFFPNLSHSQLNTTRNLLSAAYHTYCRSIGCVVPPPDRIPTRLRKVSSTFVGSVTVQCPPNYNLLSCGIWNMGGAENHDRRRMAYPTGSNRCYCYDSTGATCVSWCTSAAVTFSVARSAQGQSIAVNCPAQYKVLYKSSSLEKRW